MTGYNGWKNYETWNVALWIGNHAGLYEIAREVKTYGDFVGVMRDLGGSMGLETPDGVAWGDSGLDIEALDEMIQELGGGLDDQG